ncbi:MAG: GntR family transcriptional regulator [Sphaerochaetaceae bacterium]|nr:GntR family transcriptional regulator [Sphaerochaetaceae bacterium]
MLFNNHTPIYLQIAELLYQKILSGEYRNASRIPSVRDMAVALEVNPNTVTRSYMILQEEGVIENRRGIGYYTNEDAALIVEKKKQKEFLDSEVPSFFARMDQLGLTLNEVLKHLETRKGTIQ